MFADTDSLWHLAAGDWIREHRSIPYSDPWSFTTEGYQWLNISWAWDIALSVIHERFGWHGAFAFNAFVLAIILVTVFINCILRSGNILIALFVLVAAGLFIVINLRPLQITNAMTAIWILLLGSILRKQLRARWLIALPFTMLLWVNSHGGFVVGAIMLGAFFIQSIIDKEYLLSRQLFVTGIATIIALFCNPYHISIIEAVWRPLTTTANEFIIEWQPLSFNIGNLLRFGGYIALFLMLPIRRKSHILPVEYALAYFWLVMALSSTRHLPIFAIISAPITAYALHGVLARNFPNFASSLARIPMRYNDRIPAQVMLVLCFLFVCWVPTSMAAKMYGQTEVTVASLKPELDFITAHYPNTRFFIDFDVAAIAVYESRGKIPVFVDPRTETAFPPEVIKDYGRFLKGDEGWENIFDKYNMGGAMIANTTIDGVIDRFSSRKDWETVFKGPKATIFVRKTHEKH